MMAMLLNMWDDFSNWVTVGWSQLTYILVMCMLGIIACTTLLGFLKQSNKDKKAFKWSSLFICIVMFVIMFVLSYARYM